MNNPTPTLLPFNIPSGTSIKSVADKFPVLSQYKPYFDCKKRHLGGNFNGGFIPMGVSFKSHETVEAVRELVDRTRRNFYRGAILEFLCFLEKYQDALDCDFAVFGDSALEGNALVWHNQGKRLELLTTTFRFSAECQVFIVEEV